MTTPWHTKNLGDALLASEELARIKSLFLSTYPQPGTDLAIFIRHESEGRLHCEAILYFPPAAAAIAKALNATPCAQPSLHDLGLLIGSDQARAILFPH